MTSFSLPPVGHVLVLSEANSEAKEGAGIGRVCQARKAAFTGRVWRGRGRESALRTRGSMGPEEGGVCLGSVLGSDCCFFPVHDKAETLERSILT